jgi:hypothetical protein
MIAYMPSLQPFKNMQYPVCKMAKQVGGMQKREGWIAHLEHVP